MRRIAQSPSAGLAWHLRWKGFTSATANFQLQMNTKMLGRTYAFTAAFIAAADAPTTD